MANLGLYGHEFCIYDPLVNVPLLINHPEFEPGTNDTQVELLDLYHTVLDHAGVEAAPGGVGLDRTRSLLSAVYRDFEGGETAFVEYYRPVVELNQLEGKANAAGVSLENDSRFYSRMRAARRSDAKYIHNERIPDEAYRLDTDPGERENLAGEGDPRIEAVEAALAAFEERGDGARNETTDDDVLADMGKDAKRRLEDLGYIE